MNSSNKRKKLALKSIDIQSFITSSNPIKGGTSGSLTPTISRNDDGSILNCIVPPPVATLDYHCNRGRYRG